MERIKQWWGTAEPNQKRLVVVAGVLLFIVLAVMIFDNSEPITLDREEEDGLVSDNLLMDGDPRKLGMEALSAKIKEMQSRQDERDKQILRMERLLDRYEDTMKTEGDSRNKDLRRQVQKIANMQRNMEQERSQARNSDSLSDEEAAKAFDASPQTVSPNAGADSEGHSSAQVRESFEEDPFSAGAASPTAEGGKDSYTESSEGSQAIRVIGEREVEEEDKDSKAVESPLPAGSIVTGVMLHGLDAPATGQGSGQPHPVLIRVKHEAILPNRYRSDIRECHLIASGYGDLSTERAFFRTDRFSCVTDTNEVVDVNLKAYAVGEDGKLGLRGRVVTKQGSLIARTMWAGFLKGWGEALGGTNNQNYTLETDSSSLDDLRQNMRDQAVAEGVSTGVSDSMDRLAKFYIKMAEGMVPVVEIDAGRKVSLVVTGGTSIPSLHD